jgi:branched-chain amino acid transport system substrate-binding protein
LAVRGIVTPQTVGKASHRFGARWEECSDDQDRIGGRSCARPGGGARRSSGKDGGPGALIGNDMRNALELGLDHLGRKLGGLPVEIIYEDDRQKPEAGVQKVQKLIESDKVDFIAGFIWSNVLLAALKPIVDSKVITVINNAGPSQLAAELCSPYVFSTSWTSEQTPRAMGRYMNQKGIKSVFLIGPNYASGRDQLRGMREIFEGQVLGQK